MNNILQVMMYRINMAELELDDHNLIKAQAMLDEAKNEIRKLSQLLIDNVR